MDPTQRRRLYDDLRGIVRGELLFDELSRALYATDASLFEVEPAGVVVPADEDDLCALVRYAGENALPLIPRGAGSGLAGEALGAGVVVDLSVNFRSMTLSGDAVVAESGVTLRRLNAALAESGRRFAPDPDHVECTVGGMLATNAAGPRAFRLGTPRDHVRGLRLVLDSGDAADVPRYLPWPTLAPTPGRLEDILAATVTLLEQTEARRRIASPPEVPFDRAGYHLSGVVAPGSIDLSRLLVGSEGTLGIVTSATLRTAPLPGGTSLLLLSFARLDAALRAARLALPSLPTMCELLDRRLLRLARGEAATAEVVPEGAEAVLLVEYEADSPEAALALAAELAGRLHRRERLALSAFVAATPEEAETLRNLRRASLPGLHSLRKGSRPVNLVEDAAVPPASLPDFIRRLQDVLRRQEITAAFLIRPATGQVQMRPFVDLDDPKEAARLWPLADEVYSLVLETGGTVSAQHGTGIARMPWVGRQVGVLAPVYRELKAIFDPRFVFNPGKIVPPPSQPLTWPLRKRVPPADPRPDGVPVTEGTSPTHLAWTDTTPEREANACNGCGECRTDDPARRMCPVFRADHAEEATPRAKANMLRKLLHPDTDPAAMTANEVRDVADLCVNCKSCARECPSKVDIPRMMLEAKAAHVARHGLDRADWVLARTESFAWLGSAVAPLANAVMANPVARWLLEKVFGVSRRRRLPMFASRTFMSLAKKRGWTRKPRSAKNAVAFFVDVFANYNDPLIAEAVVAVLHHNGVEVYVPPDQLGCGMAPLTYGDVDTARETVEHNLHTLADLAREGYPILCAEPTAALMFRRDAIDLMNSPDARAVAEATVEFSSYLGDRHRLGKLRTDFPVRLDAGVGHHVPCHVKALGPETAGPALLGLVPGLRVGTIDVGCSGMAGTFGFRAGRYELSLAAGGPMLAALDAPRYLFGSTECSACRLQMEDGTRKRTLHPAQYLALAYGLMPELMDRLREPIGRWVLQ